LSADEGACCEDFIAHFSRAHLLLKQPLGNSRRFSAQVENRPPTLPILISAGEQNKHTPFGRPVVHPFSQAALLG
jgi:hypothetical protein